MSSHEHQNRDREQHTHSAQQARDHVRRTLDEAATPEPDHRGQERNAAVAIAVLAVVVVVLLIAMASGAIGMFRP